MDLGSVRESNSVLVALLLAWVRHASKAGRTLHFDNVPAELRQIIGLYGVGGLLPIEGEDADVAIPQLDREQGAGAAAAPEPR
jgi:hypothetical protein